MQLLFVQENESKLRLDQFMAVKLKVSRNQIKSLIKKGFVKVNKKRAKGSQKVKAGDCIAYLIPEPRPTEILPEKIPLQILYEDQNILLINKPAGLVVHPDQTSHSSGTLVHAVLAHCKHLSGIGGRWRPGVVHRLDKDTSGVLVFAKNNKAHQRWSGLFKDRKVKKTYLALVKGVPKSQKGRIEARMARHSIQRKKMALSSQGKEALTRFEVLERYPGSSLLKVQIETGRTHQIRVHLASIGHPVIGDGTYGDSRINKQFKKKFKLERQFLHAKTLEVQGQSFMAPLSADLQYVLEKLREQNS